MFNIEEWISDFSQKIQENFKSRIEFIGLQGSYAREEATESSDIDVVVIFDKLEMNDLKKYDEIISKMPCREKICGFLSGKDEVANWEKSDLFQFYYDTKAVYGKLDFILPLIKKENVKQAVLIGGCNIYHACCHNIIHEKSLDILKALFKQAVFVLQAKYFYDTENYVSKKKDLIDKLEAEDKHILELYFTIKSADKTEDFDNYSNELFAWSSSLIKKYSI
ncbi:MAG: nucleotidyltransferase domain-containing protein [Eubacterium sp.]|nr:nucleotidyltransferase domain-containing protein [Eubacterium sp.]